MPRPTRPSSTASRYEPRENGGRGYDAGKKASGRKRHIVVGTTGLLFAMVVQAANTRDRVGARLVPANLLGRFPRPWVIWADGAYARRLVVRAWVTARPFDYGQPPTVFPAKAGIQRALGNNGQSRIHPPSVATPCWSRINKRHCGLQGVGRHGWCAGGPTVILRVPDPPVGGGKNISVTGTVPAAQ